MSLPFTLKETQGVQKRKTGRIPIKEHIKARQAILRQNLFCT
jgi:hypothetical protein